ncbi:single stranded-binding protein c31A [Lycorma delicatula]|uniref:single stranded-binding protein c31A n=1 Tax=Lycorma delicatula TaxID=130591 RepID=UPI003F513E86
MPKTKKAASSSDSDSDSGPDDKNPPPKKSKSGGRTDEGGVPTWQLESRRFVKVREFKGKVMVDIREYYDADGELKPGKKGISLSASQWRKFLSYVNEIDEAVKEKC